jgi:general L-amino acid transport system substrate-binding protein
MLLRRALSLAVVLGLALLLAPARCDAEPDMLENVRARGRIACGVVEGARGYSWVSTDGVWSGISVDLCRALAAAVLGNRDAVEFRPVARDGGFSALRSGEIDVLSANIAMTASREVALGIRFPAVLAFSGQGFMVRKSQGVASALELSGTRICVLADVPDMQGIGDYFGALRLPFELSRFDKWADAIMAYVNKGCQVLSADLSTLALARQQLSDPGEHIILPEIAARQPVGPAIRQGDEAWFSVVRWTIYALIAAEELGVTSANVDAMKASTNVEIRRLLGVDADVGKPLGLAPDWTQRVIKQIGNYAELFDRNLGSKSPLRLERRLNNLAGNGGLLYAPSFR